jgi:hypothetical protein
MFFTTLALASTLATQTSPLAVVPRMGQTVRVRAQARGPKVTGQVVSIGPDSMAIARERDTVFLPARLLLDGRVKTDNMTAAGTGMVIGAVVGMVTGVVVGSMEQCQNCWFDISPFAYGFGGAILGAGAGTIVGALFRKPIWSRAAAPAAASGSFSGVLGAGDAVRLLGPDHKPGGVVTGGSGATAIVRLASGTDTAVALGSLERYVGERLNRGKNTAYGAAGGAVVGILTYARASGDDYGTPVSVSQAVGRTALLAALGAGIGYLMGGRTRHEWAPVVPAQARSLSIAPILGPGRPGVVAHLEF